MKALSLVAILLGLLALPALLALVGTARGYLATTADIAALRIEIVDLLPIADPTRSLSGPDITLRVYGVAQSSITLAEVNFDLFWQGQRVATVATFPKLPIPRDGSLTLSVMSNLDPARADATRALLASGERNFLIDGNARIALPNSDASVWLTLRGKVRAAAPIWPWAVCRVPWDATLSRPNRQSSTPAPAGTRNRQSPLGA